MFRRIDHTEIVPENLEATLSFYTDVLGFTIKERKKVDRPPMCEIVYIQLGDTVMEIIGVSNPAPVPQEPWQVGFKSIALEVENMESAIKYLKSKGVKITREPVNLGNSLRAEFEDINGLSIELREWFK